MGTITIDVETDSLDLLQPDIVGFSIKYDDQPAKYYVVNELARFKADLEGSKYGKIAHNLKFEYHKLKAYGIKLAPPYFCTQVAAYVIDTERPTVALKGLALEEFGHKMVTYAEVCGKGKTEINMTQAIQEKGLDVIASYCNDDVEQTFKLFCKYKEKLKAEGLMDVFCNIEMKVLPVLAEMELNGMDIDVDHLSRFNKDLQVEIAQYNVELLKHGNINWKSSKQLREFLFNTLKLATEGVKKSKKTKLLSTDRETLELLKDKHPVPNILLAQRKAAKLASTYTTSLIEKINLVDNRLHPQLQQAITATTRLSCSLPNIQNLPTGKKGVAKKIRQAFVAPPGDKLISADYKQIEPRILASLSEDNRFCDIFNNKQDVYKVMGTVVGVPDRDKNKVILLGIMYGMTKFGLGKALQVDEWAAQEYINDFMKSFAGIRAWRNKQVMNAKTSGFVCMSYGHKRYIRGLADENAFRVAASERKAMNTPVQGAAAEIMKIAMIQLACNGRTRDLDMLLTVHDEVLFRVTDTQVKYAVPAIRHVMEHCVKLKVPTPVDIAVGQNWGEMEEIK